MMTHVATYHRLNSRISIILSTLTLMAGQAFAQNLKDLPLEYQTKEYFKSQTKQFQLYTGIDMGMGLGFRASNLSYADATALIDANFTPKIGFFPLKQLLVGGSFDLFGSIASFDAQNSYSLYSQTWGGFMRYYLKGGFFGELQYGRGKGIEERKQSQSVALRQFQTERYSIGVGIANFWASHFNFEVLLKYNNAAGRFDDTRDLYISGVSVNAGIGFSIGR